ncbi:pilus assembly protein TadG-related protein [Streptomyces sp. NPDC055059]|uniref:pilus assembly protein TadG-related protein n=1 Tax=Streptomyces sp. NPDC005373 TaxID=3156879 RepID=UPI0033B4F9D4
MRTVCHRIRARLRAMCGAGADAERGSVTLYFLGFAVVMIGLLALVVDGGRLLMASADAEDMAAEAARAAGQEINGPAAVRGEGTRADPQQAVGAAQEFLADSGLSGSVTVSADGQKVNVTVRTTYHPILLGGFGYSDMPVTAHADTTLVRTDPGV